MMPQKGTQAGLAAKARKDHKEEFKAVVFRAFKRSFSFVFFASFCG